MRTWIATATKLAETPSLRELGASPHGPVMKKDFRNESEETGCNAGRVVVIRRAAGSVMNRPYS